jgi:dihydroneopterin aldolase
MPTASQLPGRIIIRGLRCRGFQGPTPVDQQQAHDYLVDVELSADIADAVAKDELAAAVDISEVASCVRDEVVRRPRVLLERMTADVARALLNRFDRVSEVRVKVEKPEPAGLDATAEAVELTIARGRRSSPASVLRSEAARSPRSSSKRDPRHRRDSSDHC